MRKRAKQFGIFLLALLLVLGLYLTVQMQTGNFHAIVPGEAYRSAQLEGGDLERYVKKVGIKSVINLRGENANSPWYQEEVAASEALGVAHINFRMKASRDLSDEKVAELIALMRDAKKPLLIHCNAGADRTGLASALYIAAIAKGSEGEANYQLSLRYGHVPLWFRESSAMRRTLQRVEPGLGYSGS